MIAALLRGLQTALAAGTAFTGVSLVLAFHADAVGGVLLYGLLFGLCLLGLLMRAAR